MKFAFDIEALGFVVSIRINAPRTGFWLGRKLGENCERIDYSGIAWVKNMGFRSEWTEFLLP